MTQPLHQSDTEFEQNLKDHFESDDFSEAFSESDKGRGGYFLPPEGRYTGVIPRSENGHVQLDKSGKSLLRAGDKEGRVRFPLKITSSDHKGKWVWADIQTQHPRDAKNLSREAAKVRVRIMAQATAAFGGPDFKDKATWSTSDLTELVAEVLKDSTQAVSFTVKHRVKNGEPDLDKNGNQRYNVFINSTVKEQK